MISIANQFSRYYFLSPFRICLILVFLFSNIAIAQIHLISWNLKDFGQSKSDAEIEFIANTVKECDVIAIQEVVAGYGGSQAVARLADALNRKGTKWDYSISDPTSGSSYKTERYAYLWKTSKLKKVKDAWLEHQYKSEIDREPYYITFSYQNKNFTLVNFHAITKSKQPETEIKYFRFFPAEYPTLNLIFCGDFNCPQSHTVFNPVKSMGYKPVLINQKTSLKEQCIKNECLASEYDNIFLNSTKVNVINSGVIHFYKSFNTLKEASFVSDHIPVWTSFIIK